MGTTANQIENHIRETRGDLGANLQELENKVKSLTDWKQHFQNNPLTMIGTAFGGGIVLAAILSGGRRRRSYSSPAAPASQTGYSSHPGLERQKDKALETWDNIKGALIGLAATRFKDYVGEIVPGFSEQFQRTQGQTTPSHVVTNPPNNPATVQH